jgi:hypothetical protein
VQVEVIVDGNAVRHRFTRVRRSGR